MNKKAKITIISIIAILILLYLFNVRRKSNCNLLLSFNEGTTSEEMEKSINFYKPFIGKKLLNINTEHNSVSFYSLSKYLNPFIYYSLKFQNIFDKDLQEVDYSCLIPASLPRD